MDLNIVWFILIAVLFIGFFFLEGFDYGVGTLLPFVARDDASRRVVINAIGPFWDGNEVWLLTAGGAMFAAFPHWYATLFSGFYLALVLMLFALIVRGVAFEFRSKDSSPAWRGFWDWMIFVGSLVPALLWGVAIGNLIQGVPIDAKMNYVGGFWNLLNPYALLGGVAFVALFSLHGALFLSLKTGGEVLEAARSAARWLWLPTVLLVALFVVAGFVATEIFSKSEVNPTPIALLAAVALVASGAFIRLGREGWAFSMTGLTIAMATVMVFAGLFPRVMISTLDPNWSLTIYNASSSAYTLQVMTIVAVCFVPIVLLYQGWTYWVFRERVGRTQQLEY
ncbi:MAG: cytochrome d ubiquinol oxidase subunit II [Sphingomonadaceae bacterium]